jgi:hypothetical protein
MFDMHFNLTCIFPIPEGPRVFLTIVRMPIFSRDLSSLTRLQQTSAINNPVVAIKSHAPIKAMDEGMNPDSTATAGNARIPNNRFISILSMHYTMNGKEISSAGNV